MSDYATAAGLGKVDFLASGTPSASVVGARVNHVYCDKDTGTLWVCEVETFGQQIWRSDAGALNGIASFSHPDLVAAYTMDRITGSTLEDETANSNDLTLALQSSGTPVSASGLVGNALQFDGTDGCGGGDPVDSQPIVLPATASWSVFLWVKPSVLSGFQILFSQYWADTDVGIGRFFISTAPTGGVTYLYGTSATGSDVQTTTGTIAVGTWSAVYVERVQGSSQLNISINNNTPESFSFSDSRSIQNVGFCLGSIDLSGGREQFLAGDLDQVRIFNRALTTDEIATLYNGGAGI